MSSNKYLYLLKGDKTQIMYAVTPGSPTFGTIPKLSVIIYQRSRVIGTIYGYW